jgi:hypothetical protein
VQNEKLLRKRQSVLDLLAFWITYNFHLTPGDITTISTAASRAGDLFLLQPYFSSTCLQSILFDKEDMFPEIWLTRRFSRITQFIQAVMYLSGIFQDLAEHDM